MLTAKLENGTTISVVDQWHLEELKALRKKRTFYCPQCKEKVQLKLGTKRQWHFAHYTKSNCEEHYEKETFYHLNGKKQLYQWLKKQKLEVALEVYLPLIRQRPDVLFRYENKLYALEYQCASIDPLLLQNRTKGYEQLKIIPLWVLGGNRLSRHSTDTFSLKTFEWFAMRNNDSNQPFLTYYCPNQKKIAHLNQIIPYSNTRSIASYEEHSLQTSKPNLLLSPPKQMKFVFDQWLTVKKHWRYKPPSPYPRKTEHFFNNLLYRKGIPSNLFPIEAGWPTAGHYLIESPPHYWQTFLLLECLQYQPLHHLFSSRIIKQCLRSSMNKRIFIQRQTRGGLDWTLAVDGFLDWLSELNYLEKGKKPHVYKRRKNVVIPKSSTEAVQLDQKYFYQMLIKRKEGKLNSTLVRF